MLRWLFALLLACLAGLAGARGQMPHELPSIPQAELPAEARHTLSLIEQGGPFPYRRDGVVFGNREHRLPERPQGHYREYTVPTPGSQDRGARRIVTGREGERYYSPDHYRHFLSIRP